LCMIADSTLCEFRSQTIPPSNTLSLHYSLPIYGGFEVLVDERRGSVVHYWHPTDRLEEVWIRTNRFTILELHPLLAHRAQKIVKDRKSTRLNSSHQINYIYYFQLITVNIYMIHK